MKIFRAKSIPSRWRRCAARRRPAAPHRHENAISTPTDTRSCGHVTSNVTLCAWYQLVLGHQSLAESLDYSYIKLKGFGQAGRFGRFDAELRDTVMMYEGSSVESEDEE